MKEFTDYQIQFEQVFDGAYQYLDRCGEFMDTVRKELNLMHLGVNPSGCDMESSDSSVRLQASIDHVVVTNTEPSGSSELIKIADFSCAAAMRIFQPFSIEYNRLTLSSHIPAASLEESFGLSIRFLPDLLGKMSGSRFAASQPRSEFWLPVWKPPSSSTFVSGCGESSCPRATTSGAWSSKSPRPAHLAERKKT